MQELPKKGTPMTLPNFNFAGEDHLMAQRAAWLSKHGVLSTESDTLLDVVGVLLDSLCEREDTNRWRRPLAQFGFERWRDAHLADQRDAREAVSRAEPPMPEECRDALAAETDAAESFGQTLPELHRGESALDSAAKILIKAESARLANKLMLEERTGFLQPSALGHVLLAQAHLRTAVDLIGNRSGGGLRWLPRSERDIKLSRTFLALRKQGLGYGALAFLAGSPPSECARHEPGWEKMRQRLKRASK